MLLIGLSWPRRQEAEIRFPVKDVPIAEKDGKLDDNQKLQAKDEKDKQDKLQALAALERAKVIEQDRLHRELVEKERKQKREAEEKRIRDMWENNRQNILFIGGEFRRVPVDFELEYDGATVIQVIDSSNMLATDLTVYIQGEIDSRSKDTVWIEGYNTSDMVDGQYYTWKNKLKLRKMGTRRYRTAVGGSRTVRYLVATAVVRQGISFNDFKRMVESGMEP
jgi:hypothetical protein